MIVHKITKTPDPPATCYTYLPRNKIETQGELQEHLATCPFNVGDLVVGTYNTGIDHPYQISLVTARRTHWDEFAWNELYRYDVQHLHLKQIGSSNNANLYERWSDHDRLRLLTPEEFNRVVDDSLQAKLKEWGWKPSPGKGLEEPRTQENNS